VLNGNTLSKQLKQIREKTNLDHQIEIRCSIAQHLVCDPVCYRCENMQIACGKQNCSNFCAYVSELGFSKSKRIIVTSYVALLMERMLRGWRSTSHNLCQTSETVALGAGSNHVFPESR